VPELPEVEIARRNLERWLKRRRVVRAEAAPSRIFRGAERSAFERLRGRLLTAERRGKYLLLTFEKGQGLLAHLGMTGKWVRRDGPEERFSKARLFLDDGHVVHYRDPRMFGRIEPVAAERLFELPAVRALGPDPLVDGLSSKQLAEAIGGSKQELKVALMDQGRLAGLGNLHAAEALFRARVHPARKPGSLSAAEWAALTRAIRDTIRFALGQEDDDEIEYVEEPGSKNPFFVYGRGGERCRRCKGAIESFPQGGRTTYFCPKCQPRRGR
jgi:formamidopyrimidine-DNA glycosylase